jgi:hypothetical protein
VDAVGRLHSCQEGVRSFSQGPLFRLQPVNDLALVLQALLGANRGFGVGPGWFAQTNVFFIQSVDKSKTS